MIIFNRNFGNVRYIFNDLILNYICYFYKEKNIIVVWIEFNIFVNCCSSFIVIVVRFIMWKNKLIGYIYNLI